MYTVYLACHARYLYCDENCIRIPLVLDTAMWYIMSENEEFINIQYLAIHNDVIQLICLQQYLLYILFTCIIERNLLFYRQIQMCIINTQ